MRQLPRQCRIRFSLTGSRSRISDPKTRADIEDNLRKTSGQLLGGAAVLIGVGLAYLQFTQQQETAREQLRASVQQVEQQQRAAHDLLISNQVAKGFELLGNKDNQIQQRLGGIYALQGVMNTSEQYYQPVLEALCAFVRDGSRTLKGDEPPASDIQAALTIIGRRKPVGDEVVDLTGAHIPKAYLIGAYLMGAELSGANLIGAHLYGADLRFAYLNDADLSGAILSNAGLSGAELNGVNLIGAMVTQAQLDQACGTNATLDPGLTIKPCESH
jgi:hypothetical protein